MQPQAVEQTQPLLAQSQASPAAGKVSVRFCYHQNAGCFHSILPCCCNGKDLNANQIVVPDTTTVGEFLQRVSEINNAKEPYTMAFINGYQLTNDDLIAPTVRSYEYFESPILVTPKDACCLLI